MKKYLLLLVSFFFLFPLGVGALDLKKTYEETKLACIDDIYTVLPSYDDTGEIDGSLFLYNENGQRVLLKRDLNNKDIYKKNASELESTDIKATIGSSGLMVTRYDNDNNVLFEKEYGGTSQDFSINTFNSFNDKGIHDGYILLFSSRSTDFDVNAGRIMMKINLNGNVTWQKNVNDYPIEWPNFLLLFADGYTASFNFDAAKIWKYSAGVMWERNTNLDSNFSIAFSYTEDGVVDGILLVGYEIDNEKQIGTIIKYDLDGKEIFRSSYEGSLGSIYTSVISSKNVDGIYDGYIVTASLSDGKNAIIKYDYSGKIVWKDIFATGTGINFNIIENYDSNKKFNGYLLYSNVVESGFSETVKDTCTDLPLVKYTYESYPIEKKITDKGDITVSSDKAYPGDTVKVKVTLKEGYTLKRIVVLDESGKEIEVSDDGTFIMPEGKVTVTAIYNKITNPDTVSVCYVVLGIILLISIGTLIVSNKKKGDFS